MKKILIVGNPNTGKSTLFNSLTYSNEHVGNWHGVTVKEKSKIIKYKNEEFEIVDLPGLYSVNCFSYEEEVSLNTIKANKDAYIFYLANANTLERNLLLFIQLASLNLNLKILINNYESFEKNGKSLDIKKLKSFLNCDIEIINAKTIKLNEDLLKFNKNKIKNNNFNLNCNNSAEIYKNIKNICSNAIKYSKDSVYGISKIDKFILKPYFFIPLFIFLLFFCLFLIFFLIGPVFTDLLTWLLNFCIKMPIVNLLKNINCYSWIINIFDQAIFATVITLCSFVPQVFLLYVFLNVMEESGLISRTAFMLDDLLNKVGLNGKCVYTMLMGFGCNTSSCFTCNAMPDKQSKIKTAILTPFMSCSAKLPVYTVVASAILGVNNFWLIFSLYLLGMVVALLISLILEKTVLKSKSDKFIIEFPELKFANINTVFKNAFISCKQFVAKVFAIILSMSVILWLLNNLNFKFMFVGSYSQSMLYYISKSISWIFKPLGLNSAGIVSSLLVGLMAKELIVSSMLIFNNASSYQFLISSLTISGSAVCFTKSIGISFLVFVLLYAPCISTIAVMKKEIGLKWTVFALILQFGVAYLVTMAIYSIICFSLFKLIISLICLFFVVTALKLISTKKINNNKCLKCVNCNSYRTI